MANRARSIVLAAKERTELERLVRASSARAGLSRRARAVVLMAEGLAGVEIARRAGYSPVQISRLRRRFATEGVAGLWDRPRPGRPHTVSARKIAQVVALTLKGPPPGLSQWTTRALARRVGLSYVMVHRIWQEHRLQPHRLETFKFTTDPAVEAKIRDVVGLHLDPPATAGVLCLDEKTQIQALNRTQPLLPLRPGLPARQTHDYRRNRVTSLFAALEVALRGVRRGYVIGESRPRHTGADFLAFLTKVARRYPGELHVILDNPSSHKTPAVHAWLAAHPHVHFHFTPTGASWMNLIEVWFSVLTRPSIRRGSFDTVRAVVRHIHAYLDRWNEHPVPFTWTKTAQQIIAKAVRH
jgi:transposase